MHLVLRWRATRGRKFRRRGYSAILTWITSSGTAYKLPNSNLEALIQSCQSTETWERPTENRPKQAVQLQIENWYSFSSCHLSANSTTAVTGCTSYHHVSDIAQGCTILWAPHDMVVVVQLENWCTSSCNNPSLNNRAAAILPKMLAVKTSLVTVDSRLICVASTQISALLTLIATDLYKIDSGFVFWCWWWQLFVQAYRNQCLWIDNKYIANRFVISINLSRVKLESRENTNIWLYL